MYTERNRSGQGTRPTQDMIRGSNILVRGAGDFVSGSIRSLHLAGARVVATEIAKPLTCRRMAAYSEAIYRGEHKVEGITAVRCEIDEIEEVLNSCKVPIVIDPEAEILHRQKFDILIDGIMAKRNLGTKITDARVVIALGPGFTAGMDCHAVVETLEGPNLGQVIYEGSAHPDTGMEGCSPTSHLLRAPCGGVFHANLEIGDLVKTGKVVGSVNGKEVVAPAGSVLRGIVQDGLFVTKGLKLGEIDSSGEVERCFLISEKSNAIAGGVLEACFNFVNR